MCTGVLADTGSLAISAMNVGLKLISSVGVNTVGISDSYLGN